MDKQKMNEKKNLMQQMYDTGMKPNLAAGTITVIYITLFAKIPHEFIFPIAAIGFGICFFLQFVIAPITNKMLTRDISEALEEFEQYPTTERERTKLLKRTMEYPKKIGIQVFVVFLIGAVIWLTTFKVVYHLDFYTILLSTCAVLIGAFTGFVLAVSESQKVCSGYAAEIVAKGIKKSDINKNHSFGLPSIFYVSIHILIPIILANVIFVLMAWQSHVNLAATKGDIIVRTILIVVVSAVFCVCLSSMLFKRMMRSINLMKDLLVSINATNIDSVKEVPTDLSNEFMYNVYLINSIITTLKNILKSSEDISTRVIESSNELSVVSKETSVTSLEQTAGIKELLAAMEESGALARTVSDKTSEVSLVASKTNVDIGDGFDILRNNLNKLAEIKAATESTCEEITSLGNKITGISDIAGIINSIADQTNIIAFNAELEASGAGDAGKNFYLVANEIRRLTNNTIDSTKEIRNRIIEIQQSSKLLSETSRNAITKISEGNDIALKLNENFNMLKASSQAAETSSNEIKEIINQQTASFEQIVVTLRQIAASAENFSNSTQAISQSSESLCEVAEKLKSINVEGNDFNLGESIDKVESELKKGEEGIVEAEEKLHKSEELIEKSEEQAEEVEDVEAVDSVEEENHIDNKKANYNDFNDDEFFKEEIKNDSIEGGDDNETK